MAEPLRSRKQRQQDTRARLLAAAARTFASKGFHGATVSEIAATAGYTTGAVYANFHGKEDLLIELLDAHLEAQQEAIKELAADDPAVMRERLRTRVEGVLVGLSEPDGTAEPPAEGALGSAQARMLALELLLYAVRQRPDLRRRMAERFRELDDLATGIVREWLAAEDAEAAVAPHELAWVQSWLLEGLGLRLLIDPALVSPREAAHLYARFVTDLPRSAAPAQPDPGSPPP